MPDPTAPFFAALDQAGFILIGVTNMPELGIIDGVENVLYGPTRNPWNLAYSPGGSSGGSGVAVAKGFLAERAFNSAGHGIADPNDGPKDDDGKGKK